MCPYGLLHNHPVPERAGSSLFSPICAGVAVVGGALAPGESHPELLAVWGLLMVLAALAGGARSSRGLAVLFAWTVVLMALSVPMGSDHDRWRTPFALTALSGLSFLAGLGVRDRRGRATVRSMIAVGGGIIALVAISQWLYGFQALESVVREHPGLSDDERGLYLARLALNRPFGTLALPGLLGAFLAAVTLISGAAAWSQPRRAVRAAWGGLASVSLLTLALTQSPAAAAALVLPPTVLVFLRPAPRSLRWGVPVLGVALVLAGGIVRAQRDGVQRSSLALRVRNWQVATAIGLAHPWTGVGPGSFEDYYMRYVDRSGNRTKHAHSFPFRQWAELGVAGGILAVLIIGLSGWRVMVGLRDPGADPGFGLAAMALLLHALCDIDLDLPSFSALTPFMVGMALGPGSISAGRSVWSVAGVALLALALIPGLQKARGDAGVARASDLARAQSRGEAMKELAEATRQDPRGATARLLLGRELMSDGRLQEARSILEDARGLTPERAMVRRALFRCYLQLGMREEACAEAEAYRQRMPLDLEFAGGLSAIGCQGSRS